MAKEPNADRGMANPPPQRRSGAFELWERLVQERACSQEEDRCKLLNSVLAALDRLSEDYQWAEAYVFGSITKLGRFRPESDVDIAVRGLYKFALFAFVGDLSMLLGRSVDVVMLEECAFAETIISRGLKWCKKAI